MPPRRSEGEESEYPFFKGDGSSSDEWRDYSMGSEDYEGRPIFDDDQYEEELMPVYDTDIEDVIEEEEGFVGKRGFEVNTKSHELMSFKENTIIKVEELVARRVDKEMEARKAARNLETLNENEEEQKGENGGNGNGGNRENINHGMNYGGFMPMAREC
nr:hypothetical protein [Tanacetum cinerariifolium]